MAGDAPGEGLRRMPRPGPGEYVLCIRTVAMMWEEGERAVGGEKTGEEEDK